MKKSPEVKKISVQEKIEAERNEWKALSAIRRYVKDNAKILASLPEEKRTRRIAKLQKMGYTIDIENGLPLEIGYSFSVPVKIVATKTDIVKPERKPRKPRAEKVEEVQQPQISKKMVESKQLPEDAEEKLLTDEEILETAKEDKTEDVEILAGDTFKDETEIAEEDSLKNSDDREDDDDEEDCGSNDDDDDIFGGGRRISREQEEYRYEAFREMELNGTWD